MLMLLPFSYQFWIFIFWIIDLYTLIMIIKLYVVYLEHTFAPEGKYNWDDHMNVGYSVLKNYYGFKHTAIYKEALDFNNDDQVHDYFVKLARSFMFMNVWRFVTVAIKVTCGVLAVFNLCKRANVKSLYLWSWVSNLFFLYDIFMMMISF